MAVGWKQRRCASRLPTPCHLQLRIIRVPISLWHPKMLKTGRNRGLLRAWTEAATCCGLARACLGVAEAQMMTVFVLAQLSFKDLAAYNRYQARFMPILKEFGGRLLAADERPETVEGIWEGDKVVLISFKSRNDFAAWSGSAAYREIVKDRRAGADATILLIEGFEKSG